MNKHAFPMLVYKTPGQHNAGKINGRLETYDSELVASADDLAAALKAGWFESIPDAAKAERAAKAAESDKAEKAKAK